MVRDPIRRVGKYSVKIDPDVIKQRFEGQHLAMVDQVTMKFAELVDFEDKTKTILDYEAVATIDIPFYLNFARQCYRIIDTHPGKTTQETEAKIYRDVWVARGLNKTILNRIALEVFGLSLPA